MTLQVLVQNQWGKDYGSTCQVLGFSVWRLGFQFVIMNFRLYIRLTDDPGSY